MCRFFLAHAAKDRVNDVRFVRQVHLLRELNSFLLTNGVKFAREANTPGSLMMCRVIYGRRGRDVTAAEWEELSAKLQYLFSRLDDRLRKDFLLSQFPLWMPKLAIWCLFIAIASLGVGVLLTPMEYALAFPPYVLWLLSMGALGSISFVSMNLLSIQRDSTFDLTSDRLLSIRVITGTLFALVLGLPFSHLMFLDFAHTVNGEYIAGVDLPWPEILKKIKADPETQRREWQQAIYLCLPFLLGFSTTLVTLLLNRLLAGFQTILGRQEGPARVETRDVGAHRKLNVTRVQPVRRGRKNPR